MMKEESAEGVRVEATNTPEEVMDTLRKGAELKKDLADRLGVLKNILNSIEERAQKDVTINDDKEKNTSSPIVEKNIRLLMDISRDLRDIEINNRNTNLGKSAVSVLEKIVHIYDNVVSNLASKGSII